VGRAILSYNLYTMKKLLKNRTFLVSIVILALILEALIIGVWSGAWTLKQTSIEEVTTTDMASAMRQDDFWSRYRFNTLIFDGKVKSSNTVNDIKSFALVTSDMYGASCVFDNQHTDLKIGETYKFAAVAYQAERQPKGVLLNSCVVL
jgi:hypothetical protein